jgi:hypothetical protein
LQAASGDFLIRESSRGDKCVICVNDEGHLLNLLVNVTQDGKYQFAGKDMDSLHDVVFMLRQKCGALLSPPPPPRPGNQ